MKLIANKNQGERLILIDITCFPDVPAVEVGKKKRRSISFANDTKLGPAPSKQKVKKKLSLSKGRPIFIICGNIEAICEICSKLVVKTAEQCH